MYTVSGITRTIKDLLERNLPTVWIEGEISNYKAHYSGHLYFSLKDEAAQISAVMWRSRANSLAFSPADGVKVRALGNIRLYEKTGRYQIDIIQLEEAGVGPLQIKFEALKQKLHKQGLFEVKNKKTIPAFPESIGIVTSPTGAALQDILTVLSRRAPYLKKILAPAQVQGTSAAPTIVNAINELNKTDIDLIIIARGGGSIEDLWAFNEEEVAYAIFNSSKPVVSAIGHEVDFTISDFTADIRAATPSAAAELIVKDYSEIKGYFDHFNQRISNSTLSQVEFRKNKILSIFNSYAMRQLPDKLSQLKQNLDGYAEKVSSSVYHRLELKRKNFKALANQIDALSPNSVLKRGYSITTCNNVAISSADDVKVGDTLITRFKEGAVQSKVEKKHG